MGVGGKPIHRLAELTAALQAAGVGQGVTLTIERDGRTRTVRITTADVAENRQ